MMDTMDLRIPGFCGLGMHLRLDGFRAVYVVIAIVMWTACGLFSLEYMRHYGNRRRYYIFLWITFLATVGVFLSADLYTTFIFFEIMSFTSYVWVAFDERKESLKAAETYLAVAVIGGLVMLMGLFLLYDLTGTLEMDELGGAVKKVLSENGVYRLYAAGGLLLFGFGAKAGCFPLHIWLPKAHPVAPAPASALLSGILTKTGVFGIIVVSCILFRGDGMWGLLVAMLGLVTMFAGAFLALFSVDLKRTLACSSVSQIGFILTGTGMCGLLQSVGAGNALAVRGTFLHMVNHSLFKLVLFLCAGVVFMNLHQLNLNDIRGFGRKKPALCFCFLMGALGISGIPLWSGYVSKTLLHEGIVEYGEMLEHGAGAAAYFAGPGFWKAAEWLFLLTGGMTLAYMLKLFIALFVERHPTRQPEFDAMSDDYMNPVSRAVLCVCAAAVPMMGAVPGAVMDGLADLGQGFFMGDLLEHGVKYFSMGNLRGAGITIMIGVALYGIVVRGMLMERENAVKSAEAADRVGERKRAGAAEHAEEKQYVDRWPGWLDLERLIYRPVLEVALPGVFYAVFQVIDRYLVSTVVSVFLQVSAVFCRALDHMADGLILLARKTTHRQTTGEKTVPGNDRLAFMLGHLIDDLAGLCRFLPGKWRRTAGRRSVIPWLTEGEEELRRTGKLVEESFSFGLMLFCIGLCLTLGYLLIVFFRG